MANKFENYYSFIQEDASNFLDTYYDRFLREIRNGDTDAYEMIDYGGELHEHADQHIDLREAVEILEQSSDVETDSGLWEGIEDTEDALSAKAFWTYKSDLHREVVDQFKDLLDGAKSEVETDELHPLQNKLEGLQEKRSELVKELEVLENYDEEDGEYDEQRIDELQNEIDDVDSDIEELEDQISELESEIDYIDTAIDSL